MHTQIYTKLDGLPPHFREDAQNRIQRTLRRWRHRLSSARVYLTEADGAGYDTSCRLVLEAQRSGAIVARGRGRDASLALSDALKRARERVRRREQRALSRTRTRFARSDLKFA